MALFKSEIEKSHLPFLKFIWLELYPGSNNLAKMPEMSIQTESRIRKTYHMVKCNCGGMTHMVMDKELRWRNEITRRTKHKEQLPRMLANLEGEFGLFNVF